MATLKQITETNTKITQYEVNLYTGPRLHRQFKFQYLTMVQLCLDLWSEQFPNDESLVSSIEFTLVKNLGADKFVALSIYNDHHIIECVKGNITVLTSGVVKLGEDIYEDGRGLKY